MDESQTSEAQAPQLNLVDLFQAGESCIERRRTDNLFRQLDERQLTNDEQSIIQQRVDLQRKMFQEYERREKQRKLRELQEVCPDLDDEAATRALEMCNWKEEDAAVRISSDPAFLRRALGGPVEHAPVPKLERYRGGAVTKAAMGPRPKLVDPSKVGAVFVGRFKGRLGPHQLIAMERQQTSRAAAVAAATAGSSRRPSAAPAAAAAAAAGGSTSRPQRRGAVAAAKAVATGDVAEAEEEEQPLEGDVEMAELEAEAVAEDVADQDGHDADGEDGIEDADTEAEAEEAEANSADVSDNELQYEDDVLPVMSPLVEAVRKRQRHDGGEEGGDRGEEEGAAEQGAAEEEGRTRAHTQGQALPPGQSPKFLYRLVAEASNGAVNSVGTTEWNTLRAGGGGDRAAAAGEAQQQPHNDDAGDTPAGPGAGPQGTRVTRGRAAQPQAAPASAAPEQLQGGGCSVAGAAVTAPPAPTAVAATCADDEVSSPRTQLQLSGPSTRSQHQQVSQQAAADTTKTLLSACATSAPTPAAPPARCPAPVPAAAAVAASAAPAVVRADVRAAIAAAMAAPIATTRKRRAAAETAALRESERRRATRNSNAGDDDGSDEDGGAGRSGRGGGRSRGGRGGGGSDSGAETATDGGSDFEAELVRGGSGGGKGSAAAAVSSSDSDGDDEEEASDDFLEEASGRKRRAGATRQPPRKRCAAATAAAGPTGRSAAAAPAAVVTAGVAVAAAAAAPSSDGAGPSGRSAAAAAAPEVDSEATETEDEAPAGGKGRKAAAAKAKKGRGGGRGAAKAGGGGAGAAGGGAAISKSGHTCRGRVKQKGVKRADLLSVGRIIPRQGWFNAGYIFPAGFSAQTLFRSSVDLDSLTMHTCEIRGEGAEYWPQPTYVVTSADRPDEPLVAKSCTGCWTAVLKRINGEIEGRRAAGEALPPPPKTAIAGPEYFGLNQPEICAAIEALDTERKCAVYWDGKMDREAMRGGQPVPARAKAAAAGGGGEGGAAPARAPRAPRNSTGGGKGRRGGGGRRGSGAQDEEDEAAAAAENGEEDPEEAYAGNRWSGVSRAQRYRKRREDAGEDAAALLAEANADNPLPGFLDPITLEPVVNPAISPYGHVMGLATWKAVLVEHGRCPFTKQPLQVEAMTVLNKNNIERYRSRIIEQA